MSYSLVMAATGTHRIDVVADDVAELVRDAGGWIFDHAMQGWRVTASLPSTADVRALHILGAAVGHGFGRPSPSTVLASVVVHRLSAAARSFKFHALAAAGLPPTLDVCESPWVGGVSVLTRSRIDLVGPAVVTAGP